MRHAVEKYMGSSALFRAPGDDSNGGGNGGQAPADDFGFGTGDITFDGGGTNYMSGESQEGEEGLEELFGAFGASDALEIDDTKQTQQQGGFMDVPQEQITALDQEIRTAIGNMRLPEASIPDDFDVTDRSQLQGLMNRTIQAAVAQSMQVVFRPVQVGMQAMAKNMQAHVESQISSGLNSQGAKNVLRDLVPESTMPEYSGLVNNLDSSLKQQGKKPEERAKLIRKMLNQMNINVAAKKPSSGTQQTQTPGGTPPATQKRSGASALDLFFGGMNN